jgi:hypothetical protein
MRSKITSMRAAVLIAVLVLIGACGPGSADPAIDVAEFASSPEACGYGVNCFVLAARADGTRDGTGTCEVWAVSSDGERVGNEPAWSSGETAISPGQTYTWEVAAIVPSDPEWRGDYDPICEPAPEG